MRLYACSPDPSTLEVSRAVSVPKELTRSALRRL